MLCPDCKSATKTIFTSVNGKQTAIMQCIKCDWKKVLGRKIKTTK